jgi:hypothetical protein
MDNIATDPRTRRAHRHGATFRSIAARHHLTLTHIRAARTTPTRLGRALRTEIRRAGGLTAWWRQR